ncbi:ATP-binding response regulator [Undibacterium luofuense]|uniref:Hpt domain-containing protein n=1 Tax=Undibacterium luofuense TaxID=2828733 RepID=A0A941DK53_9BURK|nr:response regulator [Undibacterium luofuense]MBR7781499.1 Hpt domain-containing protein [Undibacterium luofuense]
MQNAQALLEALRQSYIRDLPSQLDELESLILQRSPDDKLERWQELYRRVHSLKGSGGTYGLHAVSDICHPFEDLIASYLSTSEPHPPALTDFALRYLDLLRETTLHYQQQQPVDELLPQRLQTLNNAISATQHSALIVENSDVVIQLISEVLSHFRFRAEVARDGYLALGRVLSGSFDLVITGMETGRLNGFAMISAAHLAESRRQSTRFVLVTASGFNTPLPEGDAVFHKDSLLRENLFRHLRDLTLTKISH